MTQEEQIPISFCSGTSLPLTCSQYAASDGDEVADQLQSQGVDFNPIFISEGGHKDLMMKLRENPLLFNRLRTWVMPLEYKSVVPLRLDNNILFYEKNITSEGFTVFESYSVKNNVEAAMTRMLFEWDVSKEGQQGLEMHVNTIERRSNMNGAIIKNSWKQNKKNVIFTRDKNGLIIKTEGVYKEILDILEAKMNCVIESETPKNFNYGKRLSNGTWTGVIGMLIEEQFDLQGGLLTSMEKEGVLDFSWKIDETKIFLHSSKSTIPKLDVWAYVTIFPVAAWSAGLALLVLNAFFFSVSSNESIAKGMTMMGRLFLQIGYDVPTKGIASKSLLLIAAICLNLVFIHYCSDLTAKMTSEPQKLNIRSFEDAVSQGFKVIIEEGDGRMPTVLLSTAPPGSAMRRMYEENSFLVGTEDEMLSTVRTDPKTLCWTYEERELVALDIAENVAIDKSLAFKKGSELTKMFNNNLLKMQESGLINRIKSKWTSNRDQKYEMAGPIVLAFDNLFFPFACLALGIVVAVPITLTEVIVGRYTSKFSKRRAM